MDCDLQDRPSEIPNLYRKALEGYDIVYALHRERLPFRVRVCRLLVRRARREWRRLDDKLDLIVKVDPRTHETHWLVSKGLTDQSEWVAPDTAPDAL